MRQFKKIFYLFLFSITLVLSGCSKDSKDVRLFKETFENMSNQTNYSIKMDTEIKGFRLNATVFMNFDFDMKNNDEGLSKFSMLTNGKAFNGYMEMDKQNVTTYLKEPTLSLWIKTVVPVTEIDLSQNQSTDFSDYLNVLNDNITFNLIEIKAENKTRLYEFKVKGDKIVKEIFQEDDKTFKEVYGVSKEVFSNFFNEVIYQVTIDYENKTVLKIEIDLMPIMKKVNEEINSIVLEGLSKFKITMEFSNFGNVSVTIPENVKNNAIDLSNYN